MSFVILIVTTGDSLNKRAPRETRACPQNRPNRYILMSNSGHSCIELRKFRANKNKCVLATTNGRSLNGRKCLIGKVDQSPSANWSDKFFHQARLSAINTTQIPGGNRVRAWFLGTTPGLFFALLARNDFSVTSR